MRGMIAYLAACVLAAVVPLLPIGADSGNDTGGPPFAGWPAEFEGRPLQAVELSSREAAFARSTHGRMGRFTDGQREILLRWVPQATRRLHPAGDCFEAIGYKITPRPLWTDSAGRRWGAFLAEKGDATLFVREQIRDEHGQTWSDVSAWYWSAILGRTQGPWWAATVAEPVAAGPHRDQNEAN